VIHDYKKKLLAVFILFLIMIIINPIAISVKKSNETVDEIDYDYSGIHVVSLSGRCSGFGFDTISLHFGRFWWMIIGQSLTFRVEKDSELRIDGVLWDIKCPFFIGFVEFKGFAPGLLWWTLYDSEDDEYTPVHVYGICKWIYIDR
jgi:hypothetical protein